MRKMCLQSGRLMRLQSAALRSTQCCAFSSAGERTVELQELTLDLHAGTTVAAKNWRPAAGDSTHNVLALHGWMDNANSFSILGPHLASRGCNVVAMDLPGHGLSAHRPQSMPFGYCWFDYAVAIVGVLHKLGWGRFTIVGHSMGAGIATLVAGAVSASEEAVDAARGKSEPANRRTQVRAGPGLAGLSVDKVVLIEGLGPNSRPTSTTCGTLTRHIRSRHKLMVRAEGAAEAGEGAEEQGVGEGEGEGEGEGGDEGAEDEQEKKTTTTKKAAARRGPRVYADVAAATKARVETVNLHPGRQSISYEAARAIVERGTVPAPAPAPGPPDSAAIATAAAAAAAAALTANREEGGVAAAYAAAAAAAAAVEGGGVAVSPLSPPPEGGHAGPVVFTHDPGILPTQSFYTDEDGVRSFLRSIAAAEPPIETLLVSASDGWPFSSEVGDRRALLPALVHAEVGGSSHHLHLDPCSAAEVAALVEAHILP